MFTTAATATLMFLTRGAADPSASPSDHRRLIGVLLALIAGAAAGALLLDHARSLAPLLPLAVSGLVVATGSVATRKPVLTGAEKVTPVHN